MDPSVPLVVDNGTGVSVIVEIHTIHSCTTDKLPKVRESRLCRFQLP
jgi:hypothetical protein